MDYGLIEEYWTPVSSLGIEPYVLCVETGRAQKENRVELEE